MDKFFQEFREFALKGNVIDLAVGVIIGAAFQGIIKSFTENILNPIIGTLFRANLDKIVVKLNGDVTLGLGAFVTDVLNFLIMAFVLFLFVKGINVLRKLRRNEAEEKKIIPQDATNEELLAEILKEMKKKDGNIVSR